MARKKQQIVAQRSTSGIITELIIPPELQNNTALSKKEKRPVIWGVLLFIHGFSIFAWVLYILSVISFLDAGGRDYKFFELIGKENTLHVPPERDFFIGLSISISALAGFCSMVGFAIHMVLDKGLKKGGLPFLILGVLALIAALILFLVWR
jgi:hypothetical protein